MVSRLTLPTGGPVRFRIQTLDEDGKVCDLTATLFDPEIHIYDAVPPDNTVSVDSECLSTSNGTWEFEVDLSSVAIGKYLAQFTAADSAGIQYKSVVFEVDVVVSLT